jgi:hypothetical protein
MVNAEMGLPMSKKPKKSKNQRQPELVVIDWNMFDHPDPEERRAYRLWLVLRHESSWGRNVSASDLCGRLECSLPQLLCGSESAKGSWGYQRSWTTAVRL